VLPSPVLEERGLIGCHPEFDVVIHKTGGNLFHLNNSAFRSPAPSDLWIDGVGTRCRPVHRRLRLVFIPLDLPFIVAV
jgi:hypothetical protein